MIIRYSDEFCNSFRRLSPGEKDGVLSTLEFFQNHPLDVSLRNHPLQKPMIGMRAISVGEDLRIVFREKRDYSEVLILDVGNHEDLYIR